MPGFASKDAVIESAYVGTAGGYAFWMLVIAALFTSFYSWRLMFLTFWGEPRGDKHTHEHAHESPMVMLIAARRAGAGRGLCRGDLVWSFFGKTNEVVKFFGGEYTAPTRNWPSRWPTAAPRRRLHYVMESGRARRRSSSPENTVLHEAHYVPTWVKLSPFIAMLIGLSRRCGSTSSTPRCPRVAETNRPLYLFLLNKWYFDEIYDFIFVRPGQGARQPAVEARRRRRDRRLDQRAWPWGSSRGFTRLAGRAQSGYIFTYAFAMVIGIAVLSPG